MYNIGTAPTLIDKTIAKLGFSKLDFTGTAQIEALIKLYHEQLAAEQIDGMLVSHNRGTLERNLAVSDSIHHILDADLKANFPNHRFFVGHFISKEAGNSNSFQLHKDWNIVDESKYSSYQVWLPLELSYPENGGMFFIPRSQHFGPALRSGSFGIPRIKIEPKVYSYLSYTRLIPGQAVAFLNNVLHGSFSNATPENRLAVLVNLVETDAPTVYYHFNKEKAQTEIYPIDAPQLLSFLPQLEFGQNPFTTTAQKVIPVEEPYSNEISLEQTISWIKDDRAKMNVPANYEFKQTCTIKDPAIERKVNNDGFTVIPLLTESELMQLRAGFNHYFPSRSEYSGRYSSMDDRDCDTRKEIHQHIQEIIRERLSIYFRDYISPISVYYSKRPDGVIDTDWHADPSMVLNAHLEGAYRIWCPLYDIDARHGVLQVIPGSHRLMNKLVSPCFRSFSQVSERHNMLNKFGRSFSLAAGEAILFDTRIIHSSPPNLSDRDRDCIVMKIAPRDSVYINFEATENKDVFNLLAHGADYFFSDAAVKHTLISDHGALMGQYYFIDEELSDHDFEAQLAAFTPSK